MTKARITFFAALAYTAFAAFMTCWNTYWAIVSPNDADRLLMAGCALVTAFWTGAGAAWFTPEAYGWMRREVEHRKQHPNP